MPAPKYKIAVVQLYPKPMQAANNFRKAVNFIRAASVQGADLVVLPEYHLTNWLPKDPKFLGICQEWRKYLKGYRELARECNICIVPGTIVQVDDDRAPDDDSDVVSALEELKTAEKAGTTANASAPRSPSRPGSSGSDTHAPASSTGGAAGFNPEATLKNAAFFISNTGEICGSYVKKNLWGPTERNHLQSSGRERHDVIDTPLGPVGLLVCWDLAFPEAFRELVAQGAQLILMPTFWTMSDCSDAGLKHNPSSEALFVDSSLVSRAFENTCAVVLVNAGGPPGRGYMGLSQVVLPFVGPVLRLGSCAEGMGVVECDMQIPLDAEDNYQIRADLARDDWHYDYRHTVSDTKSRL